MVLYTCELCNKEFNRKSNYTRHINRKNKCVKITSNNNNNQNVKNVKKCENTNHPNLGMAIPKPGCERVKIYKCMFCNNTYKHNFHLNRHLKSCNKKKDNDLKEELFQLLLESQKKQQEQYEKRITELQNEISEMAKGKTINNYTYNTQNVQNIQVLAYNKTDISHLKDKDYKKVLRRGNFCVPNLVDAIHFNPNKPENHNIYIPNMKTGFIMCWNGETWDIRNREDVIDDIYDDKSNLLIDKIEEWEEIGYKLDPIIMTKFKRFLGKMDDDLVKNKVKEEIRFLLYNKRNKIIK
jgi:hypothetical protein